MIKQVIRLIRPGLFLPCFVTEIPTNTDILVRPRYLSICAADQRYFQGNRPPEILARKLPLALFHEAVGEVLYDPTGELTPGTFCVLLPGGIASVTDDSNYEHGAFFRSSNADGFCQEVMCLDRLELLPITDEPIWPYVFTELMSVCCQAVRRLEKLTLLSRGLHIGIWGDGAMSYMMALALTQLYSMCLISVFGKHDEKLINFSFVHNKINIADKTRRVKVDIAVECVGGSGSQVAIAHAIDNLVPKGILLLMGVSENAPTIPTRQILEKGLTIIGSSRSVYKDFQKALDIISIKSVQNSLNKIISFTDSFSSASELADIFNKDMKCKFKSLLEMRI